MVKLSVVILTFNEERNIERCIRSVEGLYDDLLVVDSNSTDRTCEIAERLGARIIKQAFLGYREQKNFALDNAAFDHVLSLDADEALDDTLRSAIDAAKNDFSSDGYTMNRLTNYCGQWIRHSGWYPDVKMRLVDRKNARWKGRNPHDRLELDGGLKSSHLPGDILHYSFYTMEEHRAQIRRFSEISANARFEEGQRSNWVRIILGPTAKFIKSYVLKLGILDGYYGWIICRYSAYATFLKYYKLMKLQNEQK